MLPMSEVPIKEVEVRKPATQNGASQRHVAPSPSILGVKIPALPQRRTILRTAAEVENRKTARQEYRDRVLPYLHDTFRILRSIDEMDEEGRKLNEAVRQENLDLIDQVLREAKGTDVEDVAILAYADASSHDVFPDETEIFDVVKDLVEIGFFEPTDGGRDALKMLSHGFFKLSAVYDNADGLKVVETFRKTIGALLRDRVAAQKIADEQLRQQLADADSTLTLEELLSPEVPGKEGDTLVVLYPRKQTNGAALPGGSLLFRRSVVSGNGRGPYAKLTLVGAGGDLKENVTDMIRFKAYIRPDQLREGKIIIEAPPMDKDNFGALVLRTYRLREFLWRAQYAQQQEDRKDAELAEWQAKGTIAHTEAFLGSKIGVAFCNFGSQPFILEIRDGKGPTRETRKVWGVFYLLERREDGWVRVVCPARLSWFFGKAEEWVNPGDKFDNVPYPGKALLRIEYAKALGARAEVDKDPIKETASVPELTESVEVIPDVVVDTTTQKLEVARQPKRSKTVRAKVEKVETANI